MVGITLSAEQIAQPPPDVRRWLEQQIAPLLGLVRPGPPTQPPERHLVGCDIESARAMLSLIHGLLPVVSVFFQRGRDPFAAAAQGLRALRLDEMARHARLQAPEQVLACLHAINEALQRASGDPDAMLTALDAVFRRNRVLRNPASVVVLTMMLIGAQSNPAPAQDIGDPASGRSLARRWCETCHVVDATQQQAMSTGAPTFAAIAHMKSTTPMALRVFLQTPHGRMPDLHLTRGEIDDVSAYILSLKR